jgi:hypothetical protein
MGGDGAQGRNRTTDTVIFSHVLYQLSYLGAVRRRDAVRAYRRPCRALSSIRRRIAAGPPRRGPARPQALFRHQYAALEIAMLPPPTCDTR